MIFSYPFVQASRKEIYYTNYCNEREGGGEGEGERERERERETDRQTETERERQRQRQRERRRKGIKIINLLNFSFCHYKNEHRAKAHWNYSRK